MEGNGLAPSLLKRKLGPPNREGPQEIRNFSSSYLYEKNFSAHKKKFCGWVGGGAVYTMENKVANMDYLKIVGIWDQKWEIVETTIGILFCFVCLFETRI